jgi:hypothetical protein
MINKIIKKATIFIIAISLFSVSFANSPISVENIIINNNSDLTSCGLETTTQNSNGFMINPLDASICQQDLSMIVLYFIFGEAIDNLLILNEIVNVPDTIKNMANNVGVGEPIMMIFRLVSLLAFSVGTIVVLINVVRGLVKSGKSGKFLGEQWDNSKVITRIASSFILLAPVGLLSLIQIIVLLVSIFSVIGGNFIWGNFLNFVQVKTIETQANDAQETANALSFSNIIIQNELCTVRTSRKLFNDNIMNMNTDYDKVIIQSDNFFASFVNWFANANTLGQARGPVTLNDRLGRFEQCMSPANIVETTRSSSINGAPTVTGMFRGNIEECRDDTYIYRSEWFGEDYNCGGVTFNYTDLSDSLANGESGSERRRANSLVLVAANNFKNTISNREDYEATKTLEQSLRDTLNQNGEINLLNEELRTQYQPIIDSLKNKISSQINNVAANNEIFTNNVELKQQTYYLYHQYALNYLMGGVYEREKISHGAENTPDGHGFSSYNNLTISERPEDYSKSYYNDLLSTFVMPAADYLEKAHCAEYWRSMTNSRKTVNIINNNLDNSDLTKLEFDMECVDIIKNGDQYSAQYNTADNEYINADQGREDF